jgi:putative transposase
MPRKNRQDTVDEASVHHIVQRSINHSIIFNTDGDYEYFRSLIRRYIGRYGVSIYNYCVMPNNVHLLMYVNGMENLSKFIQSLSLAYSSYYRNTYKYSGYLWQGRYKNFPIKNDEYLLECARYIERNPIRAENKPANGALDYKWSSYNFYANGIQDDIVTKNPSFDRIGSTDEDRREKYKEYILTSRPYEKVLDDVFNISGAGGQYAERY